MSDAKNSPTPWSVEWNKRRGEWTVRWVQGSVSGEVCAFPAADDDVDRAEAEADARLIVAAVNNFEPLIAALADVFAVASLVVATEADADRRAGWAQVRATCDAAIRRARGM